MYININVAYVETNYRNRLIYILTYMDVKNIYKILFNSKDWIILLVIFNNVTLIDISKIRWIHIFFTYTLNIVKNCL